MASTKAPMSVTATVSGPFFQRDPVKTFRQNVRDFMDAIAEEGERDVQARIAKIPPAGVRTGRTRAAFVGRTSSVSGKRWLSTAVVSPATTGLSRAEATSLLAAASAIERRHHVVRKSANAMRRARKHQLEGLMKGIE